MNDNLWENFQKGMEKINEYRQQQNELFACLCVEPCMKEVKVGSRVLVAAGLLARGPLWNRTECVVTEVADTAVKVKSCGDSYQWEEWIQNVLITDVLEDKHAHKPL